MTWSYSSVKMKRKNKLCIHYCIVSLHTLETEHIIKHEKIQGKEEYHTAYIGVNMSAFACFTCIAVPVHKPSVLLFLYAFAGFCICCWCSVVQLTWTCFYSNCAVSHIHSFCAYFIFTTMLVFFPYNGLVWADNKKCACFFCFPLIRNGNCKQYCHNLRWGFCFARYICKFFLLITLWN